MCIRDRYIGTANGGMHNVIGAYKGSMPSTALVSRSGYAPKGNINIQAFWNAARVNGPDWGLLSYDHRKQLTMFGLSEYGDTNIQAKLGYGIGGSSAKDLWPTASSLLTGATFTVTLFLIRHIFKIKKYSQNRTFLYYFKSRQFTVIIFLTFHSCIVLILFIKIVCIFSVA